MTTPTIFITGYNHPATNRTPAQAGLVSLSELATRFAYYVVTDDPADEREARAIQESLLRTISPARLIFGTTRKRENVRDVSALVFDVSNNHEGPPLRITRAMRMIERKLGCAYLLHTAHQHLLFDQRPRFRIWIPLASRVPAINFPQLWANVRRWSFPKTKGMIEDTSAPERAYYVPACPRHTVPLQMHGAKFNIDLPLLDPDAFLPGATHVPDQPDPWLSHAQPRVH